jgi:hypothetical protein
MLLLWATGMLASATCIGANGDPAATESTAFGPLTPSLLWPEPAVNPILM